MVGLRTAWTILAAGTFVVSFGQVPAAKAESPEVLAHKDKAKKIAGKEWAGEANFFCYAARANSATDPLLEPTRIFDNLYVTGRTGTAVYALTTSEGIILIDSGYGNETETVLIAGMKKLGLDPAQVKYIVLGHGHSDHFGGAAYFQQHFGTRVALSAADWDLIAQPPPAGKAPDPTPAPKRDMTVAEGQSITLGGTSVTVTMLPGHTPGAMGLFFPVKDGKKTYMAGLFGGSILTVDRISDDGLKQFVASVEKFKQKAKEMKVEVEIQNHPLYDGMPEKLAKLRARKAGDPHPFVVGQSSYGKFLDVMAECVRAEMARRQK